jgi:hypothetical protein
MARMSQMQDLLGRTGAYVTTVVMQNLRHLKNVAGSHLLCCLAADVAQHVLQTRWQLRLDACTEQKDAAAL